MAYDYDNNNIFAKILRGEIPNKTVLETDHSLAFEDISPAAPVHILVIPKGPYVSLDHFANDASDEEIIDYSRTIGEVCKITGVQPSSGGTGFRSIANTGPDAIQEVPHFHTHIIGGRNLGRMISQS